MSEFKPSRGDSADEEAEGTYKRTQMATGVHWTKADIGAHACGGPASDVGRRLGVPLDAGDKANDDGRDCIT